MKLSIVVPCFNEADNIPLILKRFNEVVTRRDVEVILVNNGSTDNSQVVLDECLSDFSFVKTVRVAENQGYGFGVLSGLRVATGKYIGWTHADMQTDPKDVIKALELIEEDETKTDIYVKGNRKGRSLFDLFFTVGMSCFESLYLKNKLWDINAQPNIFSKEFFESWQNPPHDFSLDLYALFTAKKEKIKVIRFDVLFPKRIHGQSSWNTGMKAKWGFIQRTLKFSKKLKKELKG